MLLFILKNYTKDSKFSKKKNQTCNSGSASLMNKKIKLRR